MQTKFTLKTVLIISLIAYSFPLTATIRYVSHTGSSTPPYTTWATAADSIQKCINYSVDGDTIIVANGVYYESLIVNKYLWLIGSSMDSTVIDGTGLANTTVNFLSDGYINYFAIRGRGEGTTNTRCIWTNLTNVVIENCKIFNAHTGIVSTWSSSGVDDCILINVSYGIDVGCDPDTCNSIIKNSLIFLQNTGTFRDAILIDGGNSIISNNIIIDGYNSLSEMGIQSGLVLNALTITAKNNVVSGFDINIEGFAADTAIVYNNISSYGSQRGITINSKTDMRNNIVINNTTGVVGPTNTNSDYNLYWQNNSHTASGLALNDIVADPMFVNDTIPVFGGSYDYHLQMFSPAIDAGDSNILDVDGSRSDLGIFGGPLGQIYTYQDLAPKPPANLTAVYDSGLVKLTWNKNTEADLFRYRVYRDTVPNFIYDTTKIIAVISDTFYFDDVPEKFLAGNYYYKITAIDSTYHQSAASEEVHIMITGAPEGPPIVVEEYKLLNNYPNPFNPSTKISYRLKESGYVKLLIYDIKGELMRVLVNEYQSAGYYEVEFSPKGNEIERGKSPEPFETGYRGDVASGIYLYRIEVIGEGQIPRFSDMKKMIYVK
jgi:hypothetical protein